VGQAIVFKWPASCPKPPIAKQPGEVGLAIVFWGLPLALLVHLDPPIPAGIYPAPDDESHMPTRTSLFAVLMLTCLAPSRAQQIASTALVLEIAPESRLEPLQIPLNFRISADGASNATTQTATVTAWVRATPGQAPRLTMTLVGFSGPAPGSSVQWSGSVARASKGAQSATCSEGAFQNADAQNLAQGWLQSGILACTLTFRLASPGALPPGAYTGSVQLAVASR